MKELGNAKCFPFSNKKDKANKGIIKTKCLYEYQYLFKIKLFLYLRKCKVLTNSTFLQNPPTMKNKTQITLLAVVLMAFSITSCQKDLLTDSIEASPIEENLILDTEVAQMKSDADGILSNDINVQIEITTCSTGGVNVTATSLVADLSTNEYTINWYKNTEQTIYADGQTLECVCQFGVRVEVFDMFGELVGENSIDLPAC